MKRSLILSAIVLLLISAFALSNNTGTQITSAQSTPIVLAHRGLAQTFDVRDVKADTCTATRLHPPAHGFLENTLPSMRAAFDLGADVVELDVHPTTDGRFAVFHDWTLDCRTDAKGVTREQTLARLQALDIGYGYTADGGRTFPFRGKGIGLLPSLDDVLAAFPGKRLLVHIKSNDPAEGEMLARRLAELPPEQRRPIGVYGGALPVDVLRQRLPELKTMHASGLKQCLLRYLAMGWSGYMPGACRNTIVLVPLNYAHWLWGWPHRFVERMTAAQSAVFVIGPWSGGEFSSGIDDLAQLHSLPKGFTGGIWTNRADRIIPALKARTP